MAGIRMSKKQRVERDLGSRPNRKDILGVGSSREGSVQMKPSVA